MATETCRFRGSRLRSASSGEARRSLAKAAGVLGFWFSLVGSTALLAQGYVPERVFHSERGRFADFEVMLADLAHADVVFVGERHDDPNTHRLELALLEGLARRRRDVIVSLEMFERDVQESLGHFLVGHADEAEFLKSARPWPRYATDYKPLVDFAIARDWPVVAANVPRPIASAVAKAGPDALEAKTEAERLWFARERRCPTDDSYFKRFAAEMAGGDHLAMAGSAPATDAEKRQSLERLYFAQCLKDETMAESIAQAYAAGSSGGKQPLVVHFNGAFHSDFGDGAAARAKRRLPGKRVIVVSILPTPNLDAVAPDRTERKRADYLVYTIGK